MKKLRQIILFTLLLVVILMLAGCGDSPGKVDENIRKATINDTEYTKDNISIRLPEIKGLKDESLQKKINENIKNTILSLMKKGSGEGMEGEFRLMFINDRLLVLLFEGWNALKDENNNTVISKVIHIDLTSGKVYDPKEIFKDKNYAEKLFEIAKNNSTYRLYDERNEGWQYGLFRTQWEKKNNDFVALTSGYLWLYSFSIDDEGLIPGYGVPYSEVEDLINKESDLYKAFTSSDNRGEEFEEIYFPGPAFEEDVDEEAARAAANEMMEQMMADEAKQKAAAKKAASDKQAAYNQGKADAQKVAAQKAAAQKASAQKAKAAAQQGSILWKTTKVQTDQMGKTTVYGTYTNTFKNRTMTRTNWNIITFTYKTETGQVKSVKIKYNNPVEKNVPPGKSVSAWFKFNVPQGYVGKYIKVTNQFNYSYK